MFEDNSVELQDIHVVPTSPNDGIKGFKGSPPVSFEDQEVVDEFNVAKTVEYYGHIVVLESRDAKRSWKLRFQILTTFLSFSVTGLLEQTIGSIIHYLLEDYGIDRVKVSSLFLVQFIGYLISSFGNGYAHSKVGFYGFYLSCMIFAVITCLVFASRPPFVFLIMVSLCSGLANGGQDCALNIFVGNLKYSNQLLGFMHSSYGIGCFISPLLVTHLVHQGWTWNQYYLVILSIAFTSLLLVFFLFKNETKWKYLYMTQHEEEDVEDINQVDTVTPKAEVTMIDCLKDKFVLFFSFTLFIYAGGELAVGVWTYNYFLTIKKITDSQASYITAVYWFSMTAGRILTGFVTGHYFENIEYKAICIYSLSVSIAGFFFLLFQNNLNAQVAILGFVGFFIGPMFGTTIVVAMRSLPRAKKAMGVGIISGLGGCGAAVLPWCIGWVSENFAGGKGAGLKYFPLIIFVTFTFSFVLWFGFYLYNQRVRKSDKVYSRIENF